MCSYSIVSIFSLADFSHPSRNGNNVELMSCSYPLLRHANSSSGYIFVRKGITLSVRTKRAHQLFDGFPERMCGSVSEFHFVGCLRDSQEGIESSNLIKYDENLEYEEFDNELFPVASSSDSSLDKWDVISVLTMCKREGHLQHGRIYHALIEKTGLGGDKFVNTSLLDMYAKCGDMESAELLFHTPQLDIASCNCLISGYASNGALDPAFFYFSRIGSMGTRPNHYTYSIMLAACGTLSAIQEGKQLHAHVVKMQYLSNIVVTNALLTMYSKCGMMQEVQSLFQGFVERNLISWTTIIYGLYQQEHFQKALRQFCLMRETEIEPNEYTYTIALASCGNMKNLAIARMLHALVVKAGIISSVFIATAIIDMYAELGETSDAKRQFKHMGSMASNVSWNALIAGLIRNDKAEEAISTFHKMLEENIACNEFAYSNILKALSSLPSLSGCQQIHSRVLKLNFESNKHVASSLIEAYAKCGSLEDAKQVFHQTSTSDVVIWNSIIKAYSQYGFPRKAIFFFRKLVERGEQPTSFTFAAILSACSHSGLVPEGCEFFESMVKDYNILPEETHYSCMVDLLGRAGQLEAAHDIINTFPLKPTALLWRPLLAACRCHGNLQMAEFVAEQILSLDATDAAVYVTLSNMYTDAGRTIDAENQRQMMDIKGIRKEPGCSWIEVKNTTYKFFSHDKTHPEILKLYAKLKQVMREIREIGYTPKAMEEASLHHSEKLAVCFGLLHLPAENSIRIFKNLRVCSDCHSVMKYISKSTKRDIVLRDNYRFHHFKEGFCSCGDYW